MIRETLIRILFRLIDSSDTFRDIDDERIKGWLGEQAKHPGFRSYCRKRDIQLLKTFGTGLSNDGAKIWIGQRLELFRLMSEVEKAIKAEDKKTRAIKNEKIK